MVYNKMNIMVKLTKLTVEERRTEIYSDLKKCGISTEEQIAG